MSHLVHRDNEDRKHYLTESSLALRLAKGMYRVIHFVFYIMVCGFLYFEIHENYGVATLEMLKAKGFTALELRKDLQGKIEW